MKFGVTRSGAFLPFIEPLGKRRGFVAPMRVDLDAGRKGACRLPVGERGLCAAHRGFPCDLSDDFARITSCHDRVRVLFIKTAPFTQNNVDDSLFQHEEGFSFSFFQGTKSEGNGE